MMFRLSLATVTLAAALAGCATTSGPVSVADSIAANPSLSTLNELVVKAGLTETLKAQGPFTVFAPSNEAFKAVPAKTMAELSADPAKLKAVLAYHVLPVKAASADIKNGNAATLNGANVGLSKAGSFVTVEESIVEQADIVASNGVVHVVDRVLMPPVKR
ncbi:MAG: fasciclin domain-containing protein [Pseudomonadota bacterium]